MGLVISILALLVSLTFNLLQLKWRNEARRERATEKAEQARKDQERDEALRNKEQAPPEFYSFGGTPGPIPITGSQTSTTLRDMWGLVTVVNRTQVPMKVTPRRLVIGGEEWPVQTIAFYVKSNSRDRSERISLRGNDKEDYELHFKFSPDKCPTGIGEFWLESDNRPDEFSIPVRFP